MTANLHLDRLLFDAQYLASLAPMEQAIFLNEYTNEIARQHCTTELTDHHCAEVHTQLLPAAKRTLSELAHGADGSI